MPSANPVSAQQAVVGSAIHSLLIAYALWARQGKAHWLGRSGLAFFATIFALQAVAPLTRNQRFADWTYRGGPARLEWLGIAGLLGGTIADRRWPIVAPLAFSGLLIGPLGTSAERKLAGQLLFFASLAPYRLTGYAGGRRGDDERRAIGV